MTSLSIEPWWAKLYYNYARSTPPHRGKSWALRQLLRIGLWRGTPFTWRMLNGNVLAISPQEGRSPWSVGWTCFLERTWEPHIEHLLNALVKPGDSVMDIGANIGYFSAIMARGVGEKGKVWSFEPVPPTYRQLSIARESNGFSQMTAFQIALGASAGKITIRYREDMMGSASAHAYQDDPLSRAAEVEMRRLDDLLDEGKVGLPKLIKIDVEGHESAVLAGAQKLLATAKPIVVFEFNAPVAEAAGWTFEGLAAQFRACGAYRFFHIESGKLTEIDPANFHMDGSYTDFVASVTDLSTMRFGA